MLHHFPALYTLVGVKIKVLKTLNALAVSNWATGKVTSQATVLIMLCVMVLAECDPWMSPSGPSHL